MKITSIRADRLPKSIRPIPGHDGYFVSKTCEFYSIRIGGTRRRSLVLRQLKLGPDRAGYMRVCVGRSARVAHSLLLLAWRGPKPTPKHIGRHLNGNNQDNRLRNLAWGTHLENANDCIRHGRKPWGDKMPNALCSYRDLAEIRRSKETSSALAARLGLCPKTVSDIRKNILWRRANGRRVNEWERTVSLNAALCEQLDYACRQLGLYGGNNDTATQQIVRESRALIDAGKRLNRRASR